jgi:acyl CoA:acetate/3-ketoacid CoA transferase alpha subunit
MYKVVASVAEALADVHDGASLAVGGFGLSGVPNASDQRTHKLGVSHLRVVSNNCGGRWRPASLAAGRIARVTGSYIGANKEFARQYLAGEQEVELIPQGTLAERLRAGGAGIPAFYTPAGVGTQVAEGGPPWLYDGASRRSAASPWPASARPASTPSTALLRARPRRSRQPRTGQGGQDNVTIDTLNGRAGRSWTVGLVRTRRRWGDFLDFLPAHGLAF